MQSRKVKVDDDEHYNKQSSSQSPLQQNSFEENKQKKVQIADDNSEQDLSQYQSRSRSRSRHNKKTGIQPFASN
jgi:hypothetical protein